MLEPLRLLTIRQWRDTYPTGLSMWGEAFGSVASLVIYWYMSKAFGPRFSGEALGIQADYFHFVLYGDLAFCMPLVLLDGLAHSVRTSIQNGTLEPLFMASDRPQKPLIFLALAQLP